MLQRRTLLGLLLQIPVLRLFSHPTFTMNPIFLFVLLAVLFTKSLCLEAGQKPISNLTVMGTVFCDACSNNTFSKHSYFLHGVKVLVECKFKANSTEEISILTDRTTDRFGVYKVDIPMIHGFECREGREIESFCRASLTGSSSSLCNVSGLRSSTEHVAIKFRQAKTCVYNLNALNYRPAKRETGLCGGTNKMAVSTTLNSSLFFWPPFPPFGHPWPHLPPFPFPFPPLPFPSPPSFHFPQPPWFPFPRPPSFPFPISPTPNPPAFSFPFPPFPPLFTPSPPLPPPSSFPFPFPPLSPLTPAPVLSSPPPPPLFFPERPKILVSFSPSITS